MANILIVYHSQTGNTERMAESVAKGARSIASTKVVIKGASEATVEDLTACDGLILGSPEYFGYMSGMVKDFFDRTYDAARGKRGIFKKPYAAFVSAGNDGMGALNSIERICIGYPFKKVYEAVVARGEIDRDVLAKCEELGAIIAAGCEEGIY